MVHRDIRSSRYIMNVVSVTSVIGSLWNCSILCLSTVEGTWILGDVFCQVFAMFSYAMVTSVLWLTALAAFERFYKIMSPVDHSAMFSEINTRLLVVGVIFIAVVLCTAPLYGWGEYSNYKGTMELHTNMSILQTPSDESNVTESTWTVLRGFSLAKLLCTPYSNNNVEPTINLFGRMGTQFIESSFDVLVRKSVSNCQEAKIMYVIRANNIEAVDELHRAHVTGRLGNSVASVIKNGYINETKFQIDVLANTWMDLNELQAYKNIFIPFQDLGVCTFDFTDVNSHMLSSLVYILLTTVVTPYMVIFGCGSGFVFKYNNGAISNCMDDMTYLKVIYICGFSSVLFCIPYYVTNFLNANGHVISVGANFFSTMLFYMTPMCISGPYLFHRLSDMNIKQRIFFTKKSILNGTNAELRSSTVSIKMENL